MLQEYPRLLLMLGVSHPAVEVFNSNTTTLRGAAEVVVQFDAGAVPKDEAIKAIVAARDEFAVAVGKFISICSPIANRKAA